jgi:hypothetical protein
MALFLSTAPSVKISSIMNTDKLIQTVRERFDYEASKQVIKEKYEAKMLFAESGGMWNAGPELINLLTAYTDETIVLIDTYGNPCQVNRSQLLGITKERFQEQMNAWVSEYNESNTQR